MSSAAVATFEVPASPQEASEAVHRVISENKHRLVGQSPDGLEITFLTRKTMLSWELDGRVQITPSGSGSQVDLHVDTAPQRPKALLDGKKNRKSADKLVEQIKAAAS